jgi:nucleoside-diphosphate-sugar epimerase
MPDGLDPPETVLLTGGTGILGWVLATRFASEGIGVHLLVRKGSRKRLRERISAFRMEDAAAADRMRLCTGDLADPELTDGESRARLLAECTGVVHCGSERRSDRPRAQVFDVNVGGTGAVLALAGALERGCRRFLHLSDLGVAGDLRGVFREATLLSGQGFGDDFAAEARLLAERRVRRAGVASTVLRCAHPVGVEADAARVPDVLAALRGARPSLRAQLGRSPWVHVVLGAHVGDVALEAWRDPLCVGQTLHVADASAPTLREVCEAAGRLPPRSSALRTPAPWARIDTTATDALLRRAGLERPGRGALLDAIRASLVG